MSLIMEFGYRHEKK